MKEKNMDFKFETTSNPDRIKDEAVILNTRKYNSSHVDDDFMPLSVYCTDSSGEIVGGLTGKTYWNYLDIEYLCCLLYTSPSPRDGLLSRMPSSA